MIKNIFFIFCFLIFVNNSSSQNYWNYGSWNWNNPYWQWKPHVSYGRTYSSFNNNPRIYNVYFIYVNPYYNVGQKNYYQQSTMQKTLNFR
jgi:hypothetical protein